METVIQVLPPAVIDQIAAGEVIERPASVVKELVDNAIDAGARTITVETMQGGRALVRVLDDGCGMSAQDAVLAFERHATSKIRGVDDLWGITTMGFRGEALPAIASVARLTLTTRRPGDLAATRIVIEGGRRVSVSEVGAPVGTCVEVADLLWNLPARLKFLKGEATEATHVSDLLARIAMAHPELHVRLRHNGRTALDVPPDRDPYARAQALMGARVTSRMVMASGEEAGVRVLVMLGAPELAQTTARGVQLFVGRRPVRDRGLLHAMCMGYGELVPRGRYPVAIAMLDAPAGAVDINVHPQKQEVRFADAGAVCSALRHVVQSGVERAPWRGESGASPVMAIASMTPPAETPSDRQRSFEVQDWVRTVRQTARASEPSHRASLPEARGPRPEALFFSSLRYLGQLDLTYLVCEAEGELVLIDQHIAHERVELARLKAGTGARDIATQRMLFPTTLEVSADQLALAEQMRDTLAEVGYEVEAFGTATLAVKAVPGGIRHGDPAQLLRRLLDDWSDGGAPPPADRVDRVLAEIACHSVVRAGDRLTPGEAEALLRALDGAELGARVPHGRPVLLRLPLAEIARRFGR